MIKALYMIIPLQVSYQFSMLILLVNIIIRFICSEFTFEGSLLIFLYKNFIMADNNNILKSLLAKVDDGSFRAHNLGVSSPATGGSSVLGTSSLDRSDSVGVSVDGVVGVDVQSGFSSSVGVGGRVLFGSEGSTYKVVQISSDMCR